MLEGTTSPLHLFKGYTQKYLLEETLGFTLDCFPWANVSLKLSTAKNSQGPEYFCSVHFTSGWGRDKFHFTSARRKGKQNTGARHL